MAPKLDATTDEERLERLKHDHTYGITSDPLTQFSVVLSALVHDGTCADSVNIQAYGDTSRVIPMNQFPHFFTIIVVS